MTWPRAQTAHEQPNVMEFRPAVAGGGTPVEVRRKKALL